MSLGDLTARWLREAETFRRYGDERGAKTCELHAGELEAAIGAARLEALTLEEAAQLGGYSYDRLWHLVKEERIENVGAPGAPRIRRSEVPVKPGHASENGAGDFLDRVIAQRAGRAAS